MRSIGPKDPTRFDRAIEYLTRMGGQGAAYIPIIEGVRSGIMNLQFVTDRGASLPMGRIRRSDKPVMILISEDDYKPGGPGAWRIAEQVTKWCRGALVNGAGAERKFYENAVLGTIICERFLVVDTASRYVPAWMAFLGHVQALAIMPREGAHPLPMEAETMH